MKSRGKNPNRLEPSLLEIQKIPKHEGRRYSKQHQAVVAEAFLSGMSLSDVHRMTSIPVITLRAWRTRSFEKNFVQIPVSQVLKAPSAQALVILGESLRIELSVEDITSELLQRLKQAI